MADTKFKGEFMRARAVDIDNRDIAEMTSYLEDRVAALQRRVRELESENAALKAENAARFDEMLLA